MSIDPEEVAKPVENYGRAFSDMHDGPLWLPQGTLPPTGQRMDALGSVLEPHETTHA
jgi:hypothetical protein